MASQGAIGKCFTFFWELDNILYSIEKMGEGIESPAFGLDEIPGIVWKLLFYPRGSRDKNHTGCYLRREAGCMGAEEVKINFELSILSKDGLVLACHNSHGSTFRKNSGDGCKDGCNWGRSEFITHNNLIIRCRIWSYYEEMTGNVRCNVNTRIGIEKKSFVWNLKNFSTLRPGKKCTYQIKSTENKVHLMSLDLSLSKGLNSEENVLFELSLQDQTIKFATLQLFLIVSSGIRRKCNQAEIWFDDPDECKLLTFTYTKKKLLAGKSICLPDDTLSLIWEWTFSKGVVSEEIEEDENFCICPEVEVSDCKETNDLLLLGSDANKDKIYLLNDSQDNTLLNDLVNNVKFLYDEHFLSDVKLKTGTSVFPAHKIILSASSAVFKAMFSNDMKEKISDCVNIEDLGEDIVSRMLHFIYTTQVGDLTWAQATQLYVAADKYAILSLKNICSSILKKNLSPSNACEVLILSDLHADSDLKSAAQDYILKNGKQITKSEEWKILMQTNAKLAAETLCLLFK